MGVSLRVRSFRIATGAKLRTPKIALAGLQRSGTNFLEALLVQTFGEDSYVNAFWKHALPSELTSECPQDVAVAVLSRHPLMWLQSCVKGYDGDLSVHRRGFFQEKDRLIGYARLYNRFYLEWLAWLDSHTGRLLRYEQLIGGDLSALERLSRRRALVGHVHQPAHVPSSVAWSDADLQDNLGLRCRIDGPEAERFWSLLDSDLLDNLRYRISDVQFVAGESDRELAYRATHGAGIVDQGQYERLKSLAEGRYEQDPWVLFAVGREQVRRGECEKARRLFARALDLCAGHDEARALKSGSALLAIDIVDAISAAEGAVQSEISGDWDQEHLTALLTSQLALLNRHYQNVVTHPPDHAGFEILHSDNLAILSRVCRRSGSVKEAMGHLKAAIALAPEKAELRGVAASTLLELGDESGALQALAAAIELAPQRSDLHAALCEILLKRGDFARALTEAAEAARHDACDPRHLHMHGVLLMRFGRWLEAETSFHRALEINPRQYGSWFEMSSTLERQGRLPEALSCASCAVEGSPGEAWWVHHRSVILMRLKRWGDAEAGFRRALEMDPHQWESWLELSSSLARQGRLSEALPAAIHAVASGGDGPRVDRQLGLLLALCGHILPALNRFRAVGGRKRPVLGPTVRMLICWIIAWAAKGGRARDRI